VRSFLEKYFQKHWLLLVLKNVSMKHHKSIRKFGRTRNVRNALIKSLAISLIRHGKIETTEAKAKELRPFIESLVTKAKADTVASRRLVASRLINQEDETRKLFTEIAPKYINILGGYTRIIKLGARVSDSAKMAIIEFV
jgi:large subunit ribosomal protein L17